MYPYYNDYQFKIEYDPQNNKYAFAKNHIGTQAWVSIDEVDYTDTDSNTIYVAKTGSNSNAGTAAAPKLTLLAAINACTASKTKVLVQDSNTYAEELDTMNNSYFEGLYCETGQTPTYTLRILDFTPADGNAIFVAKTGSDGDAGTQAAPKLTIAGAIAVVDGTHQAVVIMDSGTYVEAGFEFTGNFKKLVAADGQNPVIDIKDNPNFFYSTITTKVSEIIFNTSGTTYPYSAVFSDDSFVIVYRSDADNKGKFIIYDSDGVNKKTQTEFCANATMTYFSVDVFSNDNFVIIYVDPADNKGKFQIFDSSGTVVVAETTFNAAATLTTGVVVLSNNNFVITYKTGGGLVDIYFVIYDSTGIEVVSAVLVKSSGYGYNITKFSNDNFLLAYVDFATSNGCFVIYDSSGSSVVAETTFNAAVTAYCRTAVMDSDNFVVEFRDFDSNGKFMVYDSSGVNVVGITTFNAATTVPYCVKKIFENCFIIIYNNNAATDEYIIYNEDGTNCVAAKTIGGNNNICVFSNNDFATIYRSNINTNGRFVIYYTPQFDGIKVSTAATINGIKFTSYYGNSIYRYFLGNAAKTTMKWCEIIEADHGANNAYAIYSDSELDIKNCTIHDNDIGIYSAENTATIKDNLIYRNNYGYGIHINGTGATISVTHNTVFNNYNGIRFEGNGGSEVVKNNIIFDNDIYGILAATTVTQFYSINTNTNSGVTNGTSCISANPLFINDGSLVPANTNLKLKLRVLGYFTDSPAYQLGDDTAPDRDAGAWNVVPIGSATTWTSATIEKPAEGIKVTYVPVGETSLIKKDGSIETYVDAWREEVVLKFEGILNADFTTILAILMCDSNTVRFYPDPTTYSSNFNTYTVVYKEVNGSTKNFRLSETGRQDVTLVLSRAYA